MAELPNAGPTARPARTAGQPTDLARTGTICTVAKVNAKNTGHGVVAQPTSSRRCAMTMPPPALPAPRPRRPAGGLHYSWIIVGILVVVQVIGSAISQSAGVMVTPLRDPHGDFGWGIGIIGVLMAVYYLVG